VKRIISIFLVVIISIAVLQVNAWESGSISLEEATDKLLENNTSLKTLAFQEEKAWNNYTKSRDTTRNINTEGYTYSSGGEEKFEEYDDYTKMLMLKRTELSPEQAKLSWTKAKNAFLNYFL